MAADGERIRLWRQALALVAGGLVAVGSVVAWYRFRAAGLQFMGGGALAFLPLLTGLVIGLVMRFAGDAGTFGLAGFALFVTLLAGFVGATLQEKTEVDHRLGQFAAAAYDETKEYA